MPIRLYLDDERTTPAGWVRVYTAPEAIRMLEAGDVAEISLDHDLGDLKADPTLGTGYDVACWIEEHAYDGSCPKLTWGIHSANPPGRINMTAALNNADRFWSQR